MIKVRQLVVEGAGEFPFDMLRYDSACPDTEADAVAMKGTERRRICLRRFAIRNRPPTTDRWASYLWTVVSDDAPKRTSHHVVFGSGNVRCKETGTVVANATIQRSSEGLRKMLDDVCGLVHETSQTGDDRTEL